VRLLVTCIRIARDAANEHQEAHTGGYPADARARANAFLVKACDDRDAEAAAVRQRALEWAELDETPGELAEARVRAHRPVTGLGAHGSW
jgi:hypothetical protein